MRVVGIIQARMGSVRLPGKSMMPLAGKPLLQNVLERVQRATRLDSVVVAVPASDYDTFMTIRGALSLCPCPGDPNDLVGRYLFAAGLEGADIIVRICADNPCIEPEYIDQAVDFYLNYPVAFYSNTTDAVHGEFVDGIGAEVFSLSRLKWLDAITKDKPVLREHPHKAFRFRLPDADIRLDINTQGD